MKTLACAIFIVFSIPLAVADFDLGLDYYNQKKFTKAFKEFKESAENGDYNAQFNLGVMYLNGEGTQADLLNAYAWTKLAAQASYYEQKEIHKKIFAELNEKERELAEKKYNDAYKAHNTNAILEKLKPNFTNTVPTENIRILRATIPDYPEPKPLNKYNSGWVDVVFSVAKDGTTRDYWIMSSSNVYMDRATIKAIRQFLFEPPKINGTPTILNGVHHRFYFAYNSNYDDYKIRNTMEKMRELAINGNGRNAFHYANYLDAIPFYTKKIEVSEKSSEWLTLAASRGDPLASFFLGIDLLNGNKCDVDYLKSSEWLIRASQLDLAEAQYMLAIESFNGMRLEKNYDRGFFWLKRAAKQSDVAKLRLAWILATHTDEQYRDNSQASSFFSQVFKHHKDRQTYLQTAAAIAANNNDFKEAIKWQKKAIKDAEKLELPLETVNAQLASYEAKQPWRETP